MIKVQDLTFSYNRQPLIQRLSFSASAGECVVLAGPNGSGKSTALSLIAGVLKPDAGSVALEGSLGYVPQGTALFEDMTVAENLRFFADLQHVPVPASLPFGISRYLTKRVSRLSGGTKKRVSIACALSGDPAVMLFDEPCSGLDLIYRDELHGLIRALKARGCAVLYVGHETAEFADIYDRLIFLGSDGPKIFEKQQLSGTSGDPYQEAQQLSLAYRKLCEACSP